MAVLRDPAGDSGAQGRLSWEVTAGGWRPEQKRHQHLSKHVHELGLLGLMCPECE